METLLAIAKLFVDESGAQITEDLSSVSVSLAANALKRPLTDWVQKAFAKIPLSDTLICDVTVGENDPVSLNSRDTAAIETALESLDTLQRAAGIGAPIRLVMRIDKKFRQNSLSIYSLTHFQTWLSSLTLKRTLIVVSKLLAGKSHVVFELREPGGEFGTRTLRFAHAEATVSTPVEDRLRALERWSELCHFENAAEVRLMPSDLHLEKRSGIKECDDLFDRLCAALCVVFLCDVTSFKEDNVLAFKLKGYKTLSGEIKWSDVKPEPAEILFKICEWIYEGGGAADKMGIVRNLLSLHVKDRLLLEIKSGLIHSIQSGYQIYLRDNVKQYIELKNKLVEFVNELSKKAAEQGKALSDSLSKNFTGISSFLISVILLKALSQKDFSAELSPNVVYIAYAILLASLIHLCISVYLMNRELRAMEASYGRMRTRYADLLAPQDVKQAFDDHHDYRQTMQNIKCKRTLYAVAWAASICIFTVLFTILKAPPQSRPSAMVSPADVQFSNTVQAMKNANSTNIATAVAPSTNTPSTNLVKTKSP